MADAAATSEDTAVSIAVLANDSDVDGDTLFVSGVGTPAHGSAVTNANGTITYTPAPNYAGPDSVAYTIGDGHGGSATATISVTVTAVNDPPVAADDVATTMEDTAVDVVVLANDTDVDGDTLSLTGVGPAARGTAVVNANGTIHYTPAPNDDAADSFTYTITDGHGATATATVRLTVVAVDDDPVASDDVATTAEDTAVIVAVLSNDHDPDSPVLSLTGVSTPAHGTALINANGTISYTPDANFNGADAFTYTLEDGGGHSATARVSVTVAAVNDSPAALGDAGTTAEDTALSISVLANDTDVDGDSLSISGVGSPGHGSALAHADGTITYMPASNYVGTDSFIYTVSDGHGGTATASVSLTVTPVNDAPVAAADSYTATEDTMLTVAAPGVQSNDADVDGDSLTTVLVQGPTHGTLTLSAAGGFTYTPAPNVSGVDTFTYKVTDGIADSAPVVVTIAVQPVNDVPSAVAKSLIARQNVVLPIVLTGTDADGDALSYQVTTAPAHGTLSGTTPNLLYMPNAGYAGMDSFTFVADDGIANSAPATVQLQVMGASRPPEAEDQSVLLDEDTSIDVTLTAGDPEGDPLTFTIVTPPSHGTLSGVAPNLIYTPDPNYFGDDRFVFRANDGVNDSNDASVELWIFGVNDPPVVSDLAFTVAPDGSVTDQLQAVDPDGDWIFYWVTVDPSFGTVTFDPYTGEFTYVPNPDNPGYDTFTYTVFDWESQSNDGIVTITLDSLPPQSP
ncbi:MAG: hypothetical protein DMF87_27575 [Acidobacteria bacterium]|nr:MAG: hypothetical protein DMF87_27575 [Acidobacteriota bacterium]